MDYFKILNLYKEPFSNSPEPEFFYQSTEHLACLQQLELAIRLRRGLNVVMGEVGTGKTTLCRQLILKFSESEDDRSGIETHLLLDPSFSNPREFLTTVAISFGMSESGTEESEWQLKEYIKKYLFRKGVDENKTVVLIIDEGQKIPEFCLEILREFLNYETNEFKLLQIVIFAQNEFKQILKTHANFADRVNRYSFLKPLNFRETRSMIRFRLARGGRPAGMPEIFTLPGIWAVYLATGGYPRKIITFCHQIMLALIIQNRTRAGWFLVRSTSGRLMPERVRKERWATAGLVAAMLLIFAAMTPGLLNGKKPDSSVKPEVKQPESVQSKPDVIESVKTEPVIAVKPTASAVTAVIIPPSAQKAAPEVSKADFAIPDSLGHLKIRRGGTIFYLLQEIYGGIETARFKALIKANPQIKDMNKVWAGDTIHFPAIPVMGSPLPQGKTWVEIARKKSLDEAYQLFKDYPSDQPGIRLIPLWEKNEGLVFSIVLKNGFSGEAEAKNAIRELTEKTSYVAEIMKNISKDAVYFAN
jgi:general secretion pathway protein A